MNQILKCGKCGAILVPEADETPEELKKRAQQEEKWRLSVDHGIICSNCFDRTVGRQKNRL